VFFPGVAEAWCRLTAACERPNARGINYVTFVFLHIFLFDIRCYPQKSQKPDGDCRHNSLWKSKCYFWIFPHFW